VIKNTSKTDLDREMLPACFMFWDAGRWRGGSKTELDV